MVNDKKAPNVRHSTNLTIGGKTYKSTDISKFTPQTVQGIKTNTASPQKQQASPLPKVNVQSEEHVENVSRSNVVASKVPTQGASLGAAYFTTLAAGRHNSMRSNVDTSSVQTNSIAEKAAEVRASQAVLRGSYTPSNIIKNTGLEAKASFYEAMGRYNGGVTSLSQNARNAFSTGGNAIIGKTQGAFASHDDMGSKVAVGTIATGAAAYSGIRAAQTASPIVINAVKNLPTAVGTAANGVVGVSKGVWDVTTTAGRATVTLARTAQIMSGGFTPFNAQFTKNVLLNQAQITGLLHTATSQRVISGVSQIQSRVSQIRTTVVQTAKGIKTGVVTTTNAAKRSYTLVRGMMNGNVMSSVVAHQALLKASTLAKGAGLGGLKFAGQGVARGAVKGGVWVFNSGVPKTMKGVSSLSRGLAGVLNSSNDMMLQGVGKTVMLTNYGIKTSIVAGRITGRTIKTSVKGTVGAAKGTYKAINFIRQKGLRAAWARARNKSAAAVAKAGKSIITAVLNLLKAAGSKVIVPIILIAVAVTCIMSIFSAPTVAVGGIFSSLFDLFDRNNGTHTETDIRTFITDPTNGIPAKRTAYINDLYNYMQGQIEANGGLYDYVRFKTNTQDNVIEPTIAGISGVFYTADDLANIIQPIFNAVILKDYELAPTEAEAKQALTDIFNKLFKRDTAITIEYCGQSATDGSGTTSTHTCGQIHSFPDCPNPITDTHSSYTCPTCCYYYCPGHLHSSGSHTDGTYISWTTYCGGCVHACSGYSYCGGHDVLTVTLTMDGLYQLLYEYFEQPIDQLANKVNRTQDEENELSNLKDTYEICLEYIGQVSQQYGGGLTMDDLSGVHWVNGSRVGNQAIIDLALSQVGQVGGQPYWSWYGFSSRVEWCATFVSWCMNRIGHSEVRYASCQYGGVPYFQGEGRWANGGYTDLVAGDVIFFDWEGDGKANHTGLVIGTDGEYVYTVEGNSGDTCRTKKYAINSNVIMGYGLMNY